MKYRLWLLALAFVVGFGILVFNRLPEDPDVEFAWARNAISEGGHERRVQQVIDRLNEVPGYDRHASLLKSLRYLRSRQFAEAIDEIRNSPPEGDLRQPVLLITGECFYRLGNLTGAEQCFLTVATEWPDVVDAHRWLGAIYYDLGAMEQAILELNTVARLDSDDFRPYRLLGLVYSDVEKFQVAIDQYTLALERDPPSAVRTEIVEELGLALVRERRYADALTLINGVKTTPTLLAVAVESHWSLGEKEHAKRVLADSRFGAGYRGIGMIASRIRTESGEHQQATELLRAILQRDEHDFQARYQLAQTYRALGDLDAFKAELDRVETTKALRRQLTKLNTQAILSPRDPDVRDRLAGTCRKLGKVKLAEMWDRAAQSCREMR